MATTIHNFSGVVPECAQVADFGPPRSEIGVGCLMPWLGKLYVLNYVSHRKSTGTGTGLRVIEPDFSMSRHPAAVDGTYANRFVHCETSQLIIGPHVIDTNHHVRTVESLTEVRLCGTARHLTEPERLVYMLGMEGELFELDMKTLEARRIADLIAELGTQKEGQTHFKDCYTNCGRLVVVNNEYDAKGFEKRGSQGLLADYDGSTWRVVRRAPYTAVNGLGPRFGNTIFATGWDTASAILSVYTGDDGEWRDYRLPKASRLFDHKWATEWPRIRAIEHERLLVDHHGMWYELAPWAYANKVWGMRPISTHLWVHGDFCTWRGMMVIGGDNASHEAGGNHQCAEPQSGLWFGRTDDLWQLGKPKGWGGPWWDSAVTAGEPSDPYLMTGFDQKCLHLSHAADHAVSFDVQTDARGDGHWQTYTTLSPGPQGYEALVFPSGFSAHWLRIVANEDCTATAQLHYT